MREWVIVCAIATVISFLGSPIIGIIIVGSYAIVKYVGNEE